MDRVQNARTQELCGVVKGVDGGMCESVLRWFGHSQTMGNKIGKGCMWESVWVVV